MNPMRFLEAIGMVERVDFPPELKDASPEDFQRMAEMIATAQFIAHDVLNKTGTAAQSQQPDYYSGYDQEGQPR